MKDRKNSDKVGIEVFTTNDYRSTSA